MRSIITIVVRLAFLWLCFVAVPLSPLASAADVDSRATTIERHQTASVRIWNRSIVTFRSTYDGVAPSDRVTFASERLNQIPLDLGTYHVVATDVIENGKRLANIKVNGRFMFSLVEADVDTAGGETFEQARQRAVSSVSEWLEARKTQYRLPMLLQSAGIALVATLVAAFAVVGVIRLFVLILNYQGKLATGMVGRFMIGNFNLTPYLLSFSNGMFRILELSTLFSIAYLWLTFVLSLFPYTNPWSKQLSGFLLNLLYQLAHGMLISIPGMFTIVVIFFIARLLNKAITAFFIAVESSSVTIKWFEPETAKATRRITSVLVWVFALVVAYPLIPGSETKAFQGVSVFLGLMVSLGSAGLVGQLIGGIVAVYTKSFQTGDYIRIGDHEGVVSELGMLAAKIVTVRKEEVTIPNALLMSSTVINYTRQSKKEGAIVGTTVTIGYDTPWRQVHEMLLMAAGRTRKILKSPEPFILQKALSDFYAEYSLMFRIEKPEDRFVVFSELHGHIQDTFNEYGVQIMSPNFVAQPDKDIVVPKEQWYAAPARGEDRKG